MIADPAGHSENPTRLDLGDLGLDQGGHLLLKRALRELRPGQRLSIFGRHPVLAVHLRGWCREQGLEVEWPRADAASEAGRIATVVRGARAPGAPGSVDLCGAPDPVEANAVRDRPSARWGLAARGASVEAGNRPFDFPLNEKEVVWADEVPALYAQAVAAQWDPAKAVDWTADCDLPDEVEDAVVQVMTYLIENETAALIIPARFLARVHPHFREVLQLLAVQAADEARHIEVFTRRATLKRRRLGLSTVGGQESLHTLLEEPDFSLAMFLLSVLGEGSFLSLLWFLHRHGPDPITRKVAQMAAQDEARHVAFGLAHLRRHLRLDATLRPRLSAAVERRHDALLHTAGLNEDVFDALVLLAAGTWEPESLARGFSAVVGLKQEMDRERRLRLLRLGFEEHEAERLSGLHTRNFM